MGLAEVGRGWKVAGIMAAAPQLRDRLSFLHRVSVGCPCCAPSPQARPGPVPPTSVGPVGSLRFGFSRASPSDPLLFAPTLPGSPAPPAPFLHRPLPRLGEPTPRTWSEQVRPTLRQGHTGQSCP